MSQLVPAPDSSLLPPADDRMSADNSWDDLTTVLQRAERSLASNDIALAYSCYTRATELDPDNAQAWAGRAALTPDLDDAILSWAYTLALAPDHVLARHSLTERVGEKIAASGAAELDSLIALGKNLAEVGQKADAYRLLKRATELDDTSEEAWIWRAGMAEEPQETIAALNQVLALNPENKQAQAGLEWALSLQPGPSVSAAPADSEQVAKLLEQGQAALANGDKRGAHEFFLRATELDQTNEQAWLWRGSTTSDVDEALACMEQALAINPENAPAREARSWLRVKKLRETAKSQPHAAPTALSTTTMTVQRALTALLAILVILILVLLIILRLQGAL